MIINQIFRSFKKLCEKLRFKNKHIMQKTAFNMSFKFTESSDSDVIEINKTKITYKNNNQK